MRCGFKIGGGIDQDYHKSPQGYTDNVCLFNNRNSYNNLYTFILYYRVDNICLHQVMLCII